MAQSVVVVDVLVAERDGEHPLPDQGGHPMIDQLRRTPVDEATGKAIHQPDRRSTAPSSNPPASDVIALPSKPATTERHSTLANSNGSALDSVGIGESSDKR